MSADFNARALRRRTPVWAALSDLFLDTDVTLFYGDIARAIRKSGYGPEDVEHILFEEVGPVFYTNVIAENRAWSAWPPEIVRDHILDYFELHPNERDHEREASLEVTEHVYEEHWPALSHTVWGERRPRRRAAPRQPSFSLPSLSLPHFSLPALNLGFRPIWALAALLAVLALLFSYEATAVMRARARTPAILEQAWAHAGSSPIREMPVGWLEALLRVEDPGFRRHNGVDFRTPGQGMTTITQSLVKSLYFDNFTPGFAKIEQSLIARFVLNDALSKDEQLDLFLNLAYFGNVDGREIIGFRNASYAYFERPLTDLDRSQFLSLVAMLPAPNDLKPGTQANIERRARIERLLDGRCMPNDWLDVWLQACAP